ISAKAECLRRMFSLMPLFEGDFANRQKYKTALSEIIVNHARSILERNRARPTDEMVAVNLRVLAECRIIAVMTAFIRSVTENGELRADEDQILPSLSRAYIASIMAPYLARTRSTACGEVVNIR